ncbi:endo-1,4-beta-xylanase [Chitinophaga sp.]|uniref:endo-1,4-beta-xylanase n=1 Tax=Chitinophaga sp. TaxID=1869181 RepID=UPI0031DA452B
MMKKITILCCLFLPLAAAAQSRYDSLWNDPVVEQRIQQGIKANRMGAFTLLLPAGGAEEITVRQVKHQYQFGANIFMLNGFADKEKNRRYEQVFTSLFNLACMPFYWKTLEPQQGQLRYGAGSPVIYRRPPPDPVLAFCKANGITPKGHTLLWDHTVHSIPDWLPADTAAIQPLVTKRIKELGERYGTAIQTWDVVNEVGQTHANVLLPENYALKAFLDAQKYFPPSAKLMINDVTSVWQQYRREYSPYYLLIASLLCKGARIDAIGLQFHFFSEQAHAGAAAGKAFTPAELFNVLDLYGRFGKPLHISEITLPTLPANEAGAQLQAKMTRNFYRLWFSHPATEAIIWWNVADGTALAGEDKWRGGFLNEDLSPKPSYHVLDSLINKEWKTRFTEKTAGRQQLTFDGFFGEYEISIKKGKKVTTRIVRLEKESDRTIQL